MKTVFLTVAVLASILILGVIGLSAEVYAPPAPKVVICHIPPGNPDNAHTIEVSEYAVDSHLAHGDTLGECGAPPPGPTCEAPEDPLDGNLIIFLHDADDIGVGCIECEVFAERQAPICPRHFSDKLGEGTSDQNGMLSLTIPPGLSFVTVSCDSSENAEFTEFYFVPVTEPITEADLPIGSGATFCDPL